MSQPLHVDVAAVTSLANSMDELSHRAQDVLSRYQEAVQHGQAAQILNGKAGDTNVVTGEEIRAAQMKIQARFQNVNDLLRQNAGTYDNVDHDAAANVAQVASSLRFT